MNDEAAQRVLILAPIGRDAPASAELLGKAGLAALVCNSLDSLQDELQKGAVALFVAEEALFGRDLLPLQAWMETQPPWSDLPVVMLTSRHHDRRVSTWRSDIVSRLGNVVLLERPVHPITLTSTLQAAVRARRRQYELRHLLEARERAAAELARKVAEATGELRQQMERQARIEDTLRQAQKMEAIGQLTGGVAHDFNNLLMVISAGLDMVQHGKKAEEHNAIVMEGMRNAVQRGVGLTRQLLAFSRRQPLKTEPVDLARRLTGMRHLIDRSLGGKLGLEMQLAGGLWPVEVDAGELELTVLNLVFNARDAMPNGGTITVRAENVANWRGPPGQGTDMPDKSLEGDFVRLAVVDTGIGMTPETQARVFEPFFTTKEIGKGSGLGLAQAYAFARGSGGLVQIHSKLGHGTTISVMLPRSHKRPHEPAAQAQRIEVTDKSARLRILLVEDDDHVAALVGEMLGHLGHEVLRTGSASAALGALANERVIDLVFSDIMMPGGMNGLELASELGRRWPHMPVLLTSGYPDATREQAKAQGRQILAKPYDLDRLKAALAEVIAAKVPRLLC